MGDAKSPVTGRNFKALDKDYAKRKADVARPIANLELSGDMLDALDYEIKGNEIEIGIWGDEAPKADGHNNHSGDSSLPTRRFIPKQGEDNFRPSILQQVKSIIEEFE